MEVKFMWIFGIAFVVYNTQAEPIEVFKTPNIDIISRPTGGNLVISCTAIRSNDHVDDADFEWKKVNTDEFTTTETEINLSRGRIHYDLPVNGTSFLYIGNIQSDDSGQYICKASSASSSDTQHVELVVYEDIVLHDTVEQQQWLINSDVFIPCRATGEPTPSVTWRFMDLLLHNGSKYIIEEAGLHINNISYQDIGQYECRASHIPSGRFQEAIIDVKVYDLPSKPKSAFINRYGDDHNKIQIRMIPDSNVPDEFPITYYHLELDGVDKYNFTEESRVIGISHSGGQNSARIEWSSLPYSRYNNREGEWHSITITTANSLGESEPYLTWYHATRSSYSVEIKSSPCGLLQNEYMLTWTSSLSRIHRCLVRYIKRTSAQENYEEVEIPFSSSSSARMSYVIRGLEAGQQYEAFVVCTNRDGNRDTYSHPTFMFTTAG